MATTKLSPAELVEAVGQLSVLEAAEFVKLAEEKHADLIVVGTHGRTGFGKALLGSVSERVIGKAKCAVLVVKA